MWKTTAANLLNFACDVRYEVYVVPFTVSFQYEHAQYVYLEASNDVHLVNIGHVTS